MADRLDALTAAETRELIGQSYLMVAANAPKTPKNAKKKAVKAHRGQRKRSKKRKG
jgi:hypothetical protein